MESDRISIRTLSMWSCEIPSEKQNGLYRMIPIISKALNRKVYYANKEVILSILTSYYTQNMQETIEKECSRNCNSSVKKENLGKYFRDKLKNFGKILKFLNHEQRVSRVAFPELVVK